MKCIEFARDLVADWTANDGGYTLAAGDVTQAGHAADRLVAARDISGIADMICTSYGAEQEVWEYAQTLV